MTESFFGQRLTDPYRWLETSSPSVQNWLTKESNETKRTIELIPGVAELRTELSSLLLEGDNISSVRLVGNDIFYLRRRKGEQTAGLFVREAGKSERLLFGPSDHDSSEIDHVAPSPDGRYVAFGVASGGSENNTVHIVDVASGAMLPEHLDQLTSPAIAWLPARLTTGRSAFYYSKRPHFGEGNPETRYLDGEVRIHTIGTGADSDVCVFGKGAAGSPQLDSIDLPRLVTTLASDFEIAEISHGTADEVTLYARRAAKNALGPWEEIADRADRVTQWTAHGNDVYVLYTSDANRSRVAKIDLRKPSLLLPYLDVSDGKTVTTMTASRDALYIVEQDVRGSSVRRVLFKTRRETFVTLPFDGSVNDISGDSMSPTVLLQLEGWYQSPRWLALRDGLVSPVAAFPDQEQRTLAGQEVEHAEAPSRDGTRVPLTILSRKDSARDGSSPLLLIGYGAYGISVRPRYSASRLVWLERGGSLAIAHVRGGGDLGPAWHDAGRRERKQNSIDDFVACAQYLVDARYTSPARLAAAGESAGGLLVGVAATQHPELFRAISVSAGMLNILQLMAVTIGPANAEEFGSLATPEGFRALLSMDAYHQVRDRTSYPAALISVGMNDARVPYWQGAKFAARLQDASSSGLPVILNIDRGGGHVGGSMAQRADFLAIQYGFFLWQMGLSSQVGVLGAIERDGGPL
ncbi:MAG: prolyl oligopeptidase family serine peptidase [Polyangiaceae bacterium]